MLADDIELRSVLQALALCDDHSAAALTIERQPNPYASSDRSEVVRYQLDDGNEVTLFCKYENPDQEWSDTQYETEVYDRVLRRLPVSTLRFYGAFRQSSSGRSCLVLEYLDDAVLLDEIADASRGTGEIVLCYRGRYFWGPTSFDSALARHSPGQVLLRHLLLEAIEEGARVFDFGTGDADFKLQFASRVNRVRTLELYPSRSAAARLQSEAVGVVAAQREP